MKANELMIGDWVSTQRFIHGIPCADVAVQVNADMLFNLSKDMDVAEPIPLTSEILEANGFVKSRCSFVIDDFVLTTDFQYKKPYSIMVSYKCALIQYVHELQHALRLCGLSSIADNFVIEKQTDGKGNKEAS